MASQPLNTVRTHCFGLTITILNVFLLCRYEIREMIQKIKILHGDTARLELVNVPQSTGKLLQKVEHNGSVVRVSASMRQDTLTGKYIKLLFLNSMLNKKHNTLESRLLPVVHF